MSTSFAIPATSLSGLAAISPAAFQLLTAGSSATSASIFDSSSSIVQLSVLGQVLGTGTTLENSLQALQGNAAPAWPASVASQAQNFVTAFNNVQQSLADVQPLLGALPDSALVSRFSATLNAVVGSAGSGGATGLGSLQSIGITAAIANPGGLPTAGLQIDQNALNAAVASNPGGTLSLLAQATQPLLQQVAAFEAQTTSTAVSPTDLTVQGAGIATNLLQNLSADTVLNNIQLNNLDLASLGLDANSLQSNGTALSGSLSATLATPAATTSTTDLTGTELLLANVPTVSLATALTPSAGATLTTANAAPPAATPAGETPVVATTTADTTASPLITTTTQATTSLATSSAADTLAADQAVSAATQTLQNLLEDPILNAINNNLFDPLYSALIAASHQSDFALPMPQIRASAIPAENPAPVFPVAQVRAISDYNQMASGFGRRQGGENRS